MYEYRAVATDVHDGDTVTLYVDLGFNTWHHGPFRLARCNARELSEPGGKEARDNLKRVLPLHTVVLIRSIKPDKYGERYVAEIVLPDGTNLTDYLIEQQWVAPWNASGIKTLPPWPRTVGDLI